MPYEILNKKFRLAQKNIDREVQRVQAATSELEKCLQRSATIAEVTQVLDGMTEKLMMMKRKVIHHDTDFILPIFIISVSLCYFHCTGTRQWQLAELATLISVARGVTLV